MKRIIFIGITFILITGLPSIAWADEFGDCDVGRETESRGFSARFDIGGMGTNTESHLEPGSDNKRIYSLTQSAKSESKFEPALSIELDYDFGNGFMMYMAMLYEDDQQPTFGMRYDMGRYGEIDFFMFYGLPEQVWEDPYLIGVDRKETDETEYGGRLAYELYDWEISYELEFVAVDKDKIGDRFSDLKRDGAVHRFGAAYGIDLGDGFELVPGIEFTMADMDGKSNQYQGAAIGLELMKNWLNWGFMVGMEAGRDGYDRRHPIFNKTREDDTIEAMAAVSWFNPLGFENFALSFGGGYETTDSNIKFYDSKESFTFMTVGYRFGGGDHDDD